MRQWSERLLRLARAGALAGFGGDERIKSVASKDAES